MRSANERAGTANTPGARQTASIAVYHRGPRGRDRSRYLNDISRPAFAAVDGGNMFAARQEDRLGKSICQRT